MDLKLTASDSVAVAIEVGRREGASQPPEQTIELRVSMRW